MDSRLESIHRKIRDAAQRSSRSEIDICLVGVSKRHSSAEISRALAAGLRDIGENRIQEAAEKKPEIPAPARWHLIGPLQRNKVRKALEIFDIIHTVDRPELVERLQFLLAEHWDERRLPVLMQVNIGREPQKAGVTPEEAQDLAREILENAPSLQLIGLMSIPPFVEDPEESRQYFQAMRRLRDELKQQLGHPLPELSMGMSADYEVAVEEGATMVRVGAALFGSRSTGPQ